jgi:ribosome-binding ATPase YchF (GTP1/OBG family)
MILSTQVLIKVEELYRISDLLRKESFEMLMAGNNSDQDTASKKMQTVTNLNKEMAKAITDLKALINYTQNS